MMDSAGKRLEHSWRAAHSGDGSSRTAGSLVPTMARSSKICVQGTSTRDRPGCAGFGRHSTSDKQSRVRVQTSADLQGWRDRHTEAEIATLVRALDLGPFAIRAI